LFPSFDFPPGGPMRVWSTLRPDRCAAGGGADVGGLDGAGGARLCAHSVKQSEDGSGHNEEEAQRDKDADEEGHDEESQAGEPQTDEPGKQGEPGGKGGADGTDPAGFRGFDRAAANGAATGHAAYS
jgi:hypothetical protein